MAKASFFSSTIQFFSQVKSEVRKVTWPDKREIWVTTLIVFIMSALLSLFFFAVDGLIGLGISKILLISY